MSRYVIANWKMHPTSPGEARRIFAATKKAVVKVKGVEVAVCPPYPFLPELCKELSGTKVKLGAQTIAAKDVGAYTGDVSAPMVKSYKASYVIVGHSERRASGETNEHVAAKVTAALGAGFVTILCVGEQERNDDGAYYTFVGEEVRTALAPLKRKDLPKLIIAYEPIWAIGKSAAEAMTTDALYEMTLFVRKLLVERYGRAAAARVPILYGGSVKAENAAELVTRGGVNGLLVGSASLDAKEFTKIIAAVAAA